MQSKFAGEIELSYAGLDTFYGGLEGVIGPPSPKLLPAMREEHCDRGDSNQEFVTDNCTPHSFPTRPFPLSREPTAPPRDTRRGSHHLEDGIPLRRRRGGRHRVAS